METTKFTLEKVLVDESDLASSHFLGCPDVPDEWNDNAIFNNDEIFIGQVNLEETKIEGLNNKGILYFFIATSSRPYRGIVRYTNDLTNLSRIDFNEDALFKFNYNEEYLLRPSKEESYFTFFPEDTKLKHYHLLSNEVILLKVANKNNSFNKIFNDIDDDLYFIINKDDLQKGNYDKAHLSFNLDD